MNLLWQSAIMLAVKLRRVTVLLVILCPVFFVRAQTNDNADVNLRRLQQAVGAIRDGQLPQAEALLTSVLKTLPRDADALNLLGVVRAQQHRAAEAETLFKRALAVAPAHVGAHVNLGELYLASNRPQAALQILLAAHKLAPERADVNLNLATLYESRREHQRALDYLRLVPRTAPATIIFNCCSNACSSSIN